MISETKRTRLDDFNDLAAIETDDCILWPFGKSGGYGQVRVGRERIPVHVLALERKVGPRPPGLEAAHAPVICHNKVCMNYRHLRWATRSENIADQVLDRTSCHGENHPGHRLTAVQVIAIRASADSQRILGERYGVDQSTINQILKRKRWRHLA